jgi:hypothetical protein
MKRRSVASLPYLVRVLDDDSEVLIDRDYRARWTRRPGETAEMMHGEKDVPWVRGEYLYIGSVSMALYKMLIKIEQEFIAGTPVQRLMRMMDENFPRMRNDMRKQIDDALRKRYVVPTIWFHF